MERGLYAAATGMLAQQSLQDVLAQNIANVSTVGYKQDALTFRTVQGMALQRLNDGHGRGPQIGELGTGVKADKEYIDWQTGPIVSTGKPLDASLGDGQFFAVQTTAGERYTRAGNLLTDAQGRLMTAGGQSLLDRNNQPITAPTTGTIGLDNAGNVTRNGVPFARLKIVTLAPGQAEKVGGTLFRATAPNAARIAATPQVRPATLEQSNMDPILGVVRMITISRGFDMAQRAVTTQDDLLKQAAGEIGKV